MEETRLALLSGWNEASLRLLQVVKIDSRTVSGQILASLRLLAHLQHVESPECTTTLRYTLWNLQSSILRWLAGAKRQSRTRCDDATPTCRTSLPLSRPTGVQCTWGNLMQPLPPFSSANMPIPTLPRFFSILHNVPVGSRV